MEKINVSREFRMRMLAKKLKPQMVIVDSIQTMWIS